MNATTGNPLLRRIGERAHEYAELMRMDRPIGTFLLMWPALWALWIAGDGSPDPYVVAAFLAGVFLMRSAGCVINDYADRHIDLYVRRTRDRPIAAGRVTPNESLVLFAALCAIAFVLVLTLNRLTILMSLAGVVLAASYPFVKRYTHLPQMYLGVAFGWAVPMAFAAQTGTVARIAWLVFVATVMWAAAYDTIYAMVDREDDLRIGVKSTAILFGTADRLMIGSIQLMLLAALITIGAQLSFGRYYYLGVALAAASMLYQQYLIKDRSPEHCLRAFLNNAWTGAAVFVGIVLEYF